MNVNDINDPKLKAALAKLMSSPQGRELEKSLKNADKSKIDGYMKMLDGKNIPTDAIIKQLENNPDIIRKINSILNNGK